MADLNRYRPTAGMLDVMLRAQRRQVLPASLDSDRCRRRGLISHRDGLTSEGSVVLLSMLKARGGLGG